MKLIKIVVIVLLFSLSCTFDVFAASNDNLILVNQTNQLEYDYIPELIEFNGYKMHQNVVDAYEQMIFDMHKQKIYGLRIQSAYRDYDYQSNLFNKQQKKYIQQGYTESDAFIKARTVVAYPGTSEHQTGLAIDVTIDGSLTQEFAETTQGKWIQENCWDYGFIIRYQENKTDITGIIFEPWHLRFVGSEHSPKIKELNLSLEEYIEYLKEKKERYYGFKIMGYDKFYRCGVQSLTTLV